MKMKIVCCSTNSDFNGEWIRDDVEEWIKEVNLNGHFYDNWIDYVLDRIFSDVEIPSAIHDAFMTEDVCLIVFKTKRDDIVRLEKKEN